MTRRPRRSASLFLALLFCIMAGWAPASIALPTMPYLEVGQRPGVVRKMSRLILGTDHLGNIPDERTIAVLNEAVRLGINTFDTSPIYTDDIEFKLGAWLKSLHRTDLYVITKGGFPKDLGPGTYNSRLKGDRSQITANVLEEARGSRAKYDDAITLYLMHRDDADFLNYERVERPQTPIKTILEALSEPVLKQNYLMVGLSNWATPRVEESLRVAREHPALVQPVCNSPYFSLFEMSARTIHSGGVQVKHADMMRPDFQKGIKLMTYSPLGGFSIIRRGWEASKQHALDLKNKHERYWGHVYDSLFTKANGQRYRRAIVFTKRFNERHRTRYTVDQILNAYVLAHPRSDFLIIGPRSVEQLRRTVQALQVATLLKPNDLDYLYGNP